MLFNSLSFAIFLPVVFAVYWLLPAKYRWSVLLVSSYYFYMSWNVKYVVLILFTTVLSYVAAILIEKAATNQRKKLYLGISAVLCLGVLVFFKYFNFLSESVASFFQLFSLRLSPVTLNLILPVGISFYTFQTLGYVIDVYRGTITAEKHFGYYAAFVSFFPQLVAGPIERARDLLPQIKEERHFSYENASYGIKLMAWGFFKKMVIADAIAPCVDAVFATPQMYSGLPLAVALFLFAIQIYCDFSGYSDIAVGVAGLFNIGLTRNFKSPYFSSGIREFWSRWHITLSTWFKDYLYIPLGGNRVKPLRYALNILITFAVSGLWHGADWTFVVWGLFHGVLQVIEHFIRKKKPTDLHGIKRFVSIVAAFLLCCIGWSFFRAQNMTDAVYVLQGSLTGLLHPVQYLKEGFSALLNIGVRKEKLLYFAVMIVILGIYDFKDFNGDVIRSVSAWKPAARWTVYVLFALLLLIFAQKGVAAEFVYFQF